MAATAGVAAVGYVDGITGTEISFSIFYLLPVSLASWFVGLWSGTAIAVLSAVVWLIADLIAGHLYGNALIHYWNMAMRGMLFFLVAFLLSKLTKTLQEQRELVNQDFMTRVGNSRYFIEVGQREIIRATRISTPLSLAYIDLDNFKSVNDSWGHSTGDKLLKIVATIIQENVRAIDVVARLGGDEFCVLMPDTGRQGALTVIDRVFEVLKDSMRTGEWPVGFSIGLVTCYRPSGSIQELMRKADDLMYQVKKSGKNRIEARALDHDHGQAEY